MKVFVSWSGERSKAMAGALHDWLPYVFQGLQVWMSDHDVHAGARWGSELTGELEAAHIGVLCLTPENIESQWLSFEAGALSKASKNARVIPYRLQLSAANVGPPLSQFQGVDATEEGTLKLVTSVHDALNRPLGEEETLRKVFGRWWPDLRDRLDTIPHSAAQAIRADRELLEEILDLVRQSGIRDLNYRLGQILLFPNVKRVEVAPKEVAGQKVGGLALRISVSKKLPRAEVPPDQMIPASIFGMPTDVVEFVQVQ